MISVAKKLRSMKLDDWYWDALGAFAKAEGIDRTKLVERWAVAYIPPEHWPTSEPPKEQTSIFDVLGDGEG